MKRFVLLLLILATFGVLSTSAQESVPGYTCPDQTVFREDTPFTLEQVESLVGFSDPGLQDVVDAPIYTDAVTPYYSFYFSCTPQNDTTFVALLYQLPDEWTRLRVFKLQAGEVVVEASFDRPQSAAWVYHFMGVSGFADRNFNGLPDLFVGGSDGAKTWFSGLRILELGADGVLRDITPVGGETGPNGFADIDGDGIPELYDNYFFFVPTYPNFTVSVQRLDRWWKWNSVGHQIVAVQVSAFPNDGSDPMTIGLDSGKRIDAYLSELSPYQVCVDMPQERQDAYGGIRWYLFQILMYYFAWGKYDEGWAKIQPILLMGQNCSDSAGKQVFLGAVNDFAAHFADPRNRLD